MVAGTRDHSSDHVCWKRCSSNSCASEMLHLAECVHHLFQPTHWPGSPKAVRAQFLSRMRFMLLNAFGNPEHWVSTNSVTKNILSCAWHPVPFIVPQRALLWETLALLQKWGRQRLSQFSNWPYPTIYLQGQGFRWRVAEQWLQTTLFCCFFRIIKGAAIKAAPSPYRPAAISSGSRLDVEGHIHGAVSGGHHCPAALAHKYECHPLKSGTGGSYHIGACKSRLLFFRE